MHNDDKYLPGGPSKAMVKKVRSALWRFGIRPTRRETWLTAWSWASAVEQSYSRFSFTPRKRRWPSANEIASQYVFLLLVDMREWRVLRLPYRAADCIPASVKGMLPTHGNVWTSGSILHETDYSIRSDLNGSLILGPSNHK